MSTIKFLRTAFLVLLILGSCLLFIPGFSSDATGRTDYKELRLFRQVMGIVKNNYVKETTDKELIKGAINGMLQSLDPYSSYLTPDMYRELQVETKGEFEGLGIEIAMDNGILTIISPIEDTPAFKVGLKAGDKIVKINGESTKNILLLDAVKKMRGPKGTKVTLTIMREGFTKFKDFTIVRGIIHVHSIKKQTLEGDIPYIRIVNFQESTAKDLKEAVSEFEKSGLVKGLILDLRNNPGGLLDQAVEVANLFVDKGLIVYTDGRVKEQQMEFRASKSSKIYDFKTAILINGGSASASEIVAGCLQDHDRALLFGSKSFGKASVQTIIRLEDGGGLRLTTAYYYTPDGHNIQKKGIKPDVDLKEEIEKQAEEMRKRDEAKKKKNKRTFSRSRKVNPKTDIVVRKAIEWLRSDSDVKEYKLEHEKKEAPETALNMK